MWSTIRAWLFPTWCLNCGRVGVALCAACVPPAQAAQQFLLGGLPVIAAAPYDGVLRRAVLAMKAGERAYLDPLGGVLGPLVGDDIALIPLPTTARRRRARGYDQAVELARRIGRARGLTVHEVLVKHGRSQHGRRRRERIRASGNFRLLPGAALPALAIVLDDVCTTGATLLDGVATLEAAGVMVVGCVVLASPDGNSGNPRTVDMRGPLSTVRSSDT